MLTYATAFDYLLALGCRFQPIGRAELSWEGIVKAVDGYPLLVVEGEAQAQDVYNQGGPTGIESCTLAIQVLVKPQQQPEVAGLPALLNQTKAWVEALAEQLRREHPGCLTGVNKQSLPAVAGADLATGWRVELALNLHKNINRDDSAAQFEPAL